MYCTVDDIVADIGVYDLIQISNDTENATSIDEALVKSKIEDVGVYIDSYISSVIAIPTTNTSDLILLKMICVSLVVCDLFQRRLKLDYSESLSERRSKAIKDLERIRDGQIKMNSEIKLSESVSSVKVSQRTRQFTEDVLGQY